jgi:hypothetical protein
MYQHDVATRVVILSDLVAHVSFRENCISDFVAHVSM